MNIYQELKARGFCYQQTDEAAIEKLLTTEQVKFYVGFDPTGNSLHVGHLLPVMAMRLMQKPAIFRSSWSAAPPRRSETLPEEFPRVR